MCTKLNADIYIFGEQGRNYADVNSFINKNITPYFQSYNHPVYKQNFRNFKPFLSVLDLIFNEGKNSKNIILSNNKTKLDLINSLE